MQAAAARFIGFNSTYLIAGLCRRKCFFDIHDCNLEHTQSAYTSEVRQDAAGPDAAGDVRALDF